MKINKLIALTMVATMLISMGGGYNLSKVYASERTWSVSIDNKQQGLASYMGTGEYFDNKTANIKGIQGDRSLYGWFQKDSDSSYTHITDNSEFSTVINEDKIYTPDTDYEITYNMDGKTPFSMAKNTYRIGTGKTLEKPHPGAYYFTGWTGPNGTIPQRDVTIQPNTLAGDVTYTANWKPIYLTVTGANYIASATSYTTEGQLIQTVNRPGDVNVDADIKIQVVPGGWIRFTHNTALEWAVIGYKRNYPNEYPGLYKSSHYPEYIIRIPDEANTDAALYCYYFHYQGRINGDNFCVYNSRTTGWARTMHFTSQAEANASQYGDENKFAKYWNFNLLTITGANYISGITTYDNDGNILAHADRMAPLGTNTNITIPAMGNCKIRFHHSQQMEWSVHYRYSNKSTNYNYVDKYDGFKSNRNVYDIKAPSCLGYHSNDYPTEYVLAVNYKNISGSINGDMFDAWDTNTSTEGSFSWYMQPQVNDDGTLKDNTIYVIYQE